MTDYSNNAAVQYADEKTSPLVLKEQSGKVLWLIMNRSKSRNTLSLAMLAALLSALEQAQNDDSVTVLVLTARGPVFSAGHDLAEMSADSARVLKHCAELMTALVYSSKPVIASVVGTATAGGCQLVASCDLALASEQAHFCLPGVNIGGFCSTPLVAVGRKIQRKHAMEMALTGDMYRAQDALRFGLINRVLAADELHLETEVLAQKIAGKSNLGIGLGKEAFYRQMDMPLEQAYAFATENMVTVMGNEDAVEGSRAFFEKREPRWRGD